MKRRGYIKSGVKSLVNVPRWVAWQGIAYGAKSVLGIIQGLFILRKAVRSETFEDAVMRLRLSEADIKQRKSAFFRLAVVYAIMGLALFIYTLYVLVMGYFVTAFLCLTLTALIFIYAYREHFWYTQIKERKLGVTFKEWFNYNFNPKVQ